MTTVKTQFRGHETRAAILNAAAACFAGNGYAGTGVAEICERAGISKGALYYHFESKQAVFLELVNIQMADLEKALERTARSAVDIPESLLRFSHLIQGLIQSDYTRAGIFLEVWAQASRDQTVREASLTTFQRFEDIFTRLIQRGIDEGTLEPIDPGAGARVILSIASGTFMRSLLDPRRTDWGKVTEESIKILINGLKRRSI